MCCHCNMFQPTKVKIQEILGHINYLLYLMQFESSRMSIRLRLYSHQTILDWNKSSINRSAANVFVFDNADMYGEPSLTIKFMLVSYFPVWNKIRLFSYFRTRFLPLAFQTNGYCRCLRLPVCPSVRPSVRELYLVCTITRHLFGLESPNVHQTCILEYSWDTPIENRGSLTLTFNVILVILTWNSGKFGLSTQ